MKYVGLFSLLLSFALSTASLPAYVYADGCIQIDQTPNLYQVTQTGTSATLYFTPVNEQTTGYIIDYGLSSGDDRYSATYATGNSTGAVTYTVNGLDSSMHYFFRVRAQNECSTGPYSNWVAATVDGKTTIQGGASDSAGTTFTPTPTVSGKVTTPVTGVESTLILAGISVSLSGLGAYLFFGAGRKKLSL